MIQATGTCSGIENYSRYLSGRSAGDAPPTLYEFIPENSLLIIDEVSCNSASNKWNVQRRPIKKKYSLLNMDSDYLHV